MNLNIYFFIFILLTLIQNEQPCTTQENTFETIMQCIKSYIPRSSYPYYPPTYSEMINWKKFILLMNSNKNNCPVIGGSDELYGKYVIGKIGEYCILNEKDPSRKMGMGCFVSDMSKNSEVHLGIPHPIKDSKTFEQGYKLFENSTVFKSLLISGTTKDCNLTESKCQSLYLRADVCHNDDNMFTHTVKVLSQNGTKEKMFFVQMHGKGETSCELCEVFISPGRSSSTSAIVDSFVSIIGNYKPEWNVSTPVYGPEKDCNLYGSQNIQGRYLNRLYNGDILSVDLCSTTSPNVGNIFVHIEQSIEIRQDDVISDWGKIMNDVFFEEKGSDDDDDEDGSSKIKSIVHTVGLHIFILCIIFLYY